MGISVWQGSLLIIIIIIPGALYLGLALATAIVARRKRRSFIGWFILSLLFPFAILFAAIANPAEPPRD